MKSLIIKIFIFVLNFIYFILKLLPTQDKIVFISRQSNNINIDFKLLSDDLKNRYKKYKIVILTKKIESGIFMKILYCFHMIKQMYHLATSKVVILDSYCIVVSVLKHKKNLKVVQLWHALGSFKKFGFSIKDKREGSDNKIIKLFKMHNNYDYIFTSSPSCSSNFAEAFGYDKKNILSFPLPRLDLLNDKFYIKEKQKQIYEEYPILKQKKNIVYAPTFRIKNNSSNDKYISLNEIKKLINEINFNKYNLIIKLHPLLNVDLNDDRVIIDKKFTTTDMLLVSNYVVTDYSAITYEAAYLNKPLFFYCYDISTYKNDRSFYIDVEQDLPGKISTKPKDIIKNIENNNYDLNRIKKFSNNNISNPKTSYTKDISDFIVKIISN